MFSKKICVIIIVALLIVSLSPTLVSRSLGASAAQLPVVAIHVSGSTEANWAHTVWTYYSLPKMLEAVLSSDGTPYVELTDQAIELLVHPNIPYCFVLQVNLYLILRLLKSAPMLLQEALFMLPLLLGQSKLMVLRGVILPFQPKWG